MAMNLEDISVGKVNFVEQHGLWSDAQKEAAERPLLPWTTTPNRAPAG